MPQAKLERREEKVAGLKNGLAAYLRGEAADWRCPLDLRGTDFQRSVWNALMAVRPGETVSYSDIAGQLGRAEAVRAVASAIGANPALVAVPCHRIIGKNGALTGYRGGLPMKERLLRLEREGVAASGAAALAAGDRVAPAR
jgi:methylated-DNA-[protein]-cysteine S-methyltransferase